jgi:ArsR family transcriptional regulator, arsenate/arsenite/antimonite-responsive transcriptional repressor
MESKHALIALAALAQDTRLKIFRRLIEAGPTGLAVGEIGAGLETSPATLSFHLKELAHAELLTARQAGRFIYYAANFAQMNDLIAFLTDNCCARDGACCPGPALTPKRTPVINRR